MRTWKSNLALCIALLGVVSLAAGGAGAVEAERGGTAAFGTAAAAVASSQHDNATVSLDRSTVSLRQGEAATIELAFDGTEEATIVVGGEDAGDNVTATVTDSNGDGVVSLEFDTGSIGTMRTRFVPVDDGDDYGTLNASEYDGPLPAGEYPIAVYVGHGVSGEPTDVGTLVVNETTTPEPTTEPPERTTTAPTTAPPEASIAYEGDAETLHPRAGQVIEGTADLDAGGKLMVRLRSSGDNPFLKTREATVGPEGSFATSFNLTGVEAPANATVVVTFDGDRVAGPVDVVVVDAAEETTVEETSTPGQAGFGVGVALVATIVVAALAGGWRRVR